MSDRRAVLCCSVQRSWLTDMLPKAEACDVHPRASSKDKTSDVFGDSGGERNMIMASYYEAPSPFSVLLALVLPPSRLRVPLSAAVLEA